MRSYEELEALTQPLLDLDLSVDERALIVQILGLYPAYCPDCLCTAGSPVCHPIVGVPQEEEICPAPCHADDDEDEE